MGVCCSTPSYYESNIESESEIRDFERKQFKISDVPFVNLVASQEGDATAGLAKILSGPFFQDVTLSQQRKEYLIFVLSKQSTVVTKVGGYEKSYVDKARYLFDNIQGQVFGKELLSLKNDRLKEFLNDLFEISVVILPSFYYEEQKQPIMASYLEIKCKKEKVVKLLMEELVDPENLNKQPLLVLTEKFKSNEHYLNAGYLRELAFRQSIQ